MSENLIYVLGGLLFYQAYVTIRVVRNKSYTPAQKQRAYLLTWLVPFVGAAIVLAALATDKDAPVRPEKDVVPRKPNNRD